LGDKNGVRRMNGTSQASCQSITDCQAHEYCIRGTCVSTLTRYHDSYGTGLGYNYGTGLFDVVDESAPTWTESTYVVIYIVCRNWNTLLTYLSLAGTHRQCESIQLLLLATRWLN
jgi:hypothetical protein